MQLRLDVKFVKEAESPTIKEFSVESSVSGKDNTRGAEGIDVVNVEYLTIRTRSVRPSKAIEKSLQKATESKQQNPLHGIPLSADAEPKLNPVDGFRCVTTHLLSEASKVASDLVYPALQGDVSKAILMSLNSSTDHTHRQRNVVPRAQRCITKG